LLTRLFRILKPGIVHTFDTKTGVLGRFAAKLDGAKNSNAVLGDEIDNIFYLLRI